jgi:hypothetical protein
MLKISYSSTDIEENSEHSGPGSIIPRLNNVRRVPVRYHRTLPLPVVKRYQCIVLGSSAHVLTVGITEQESSALFVFLQILTGTAIFPVLVEPKKMRLLIARVERYQRFRKRYSHAYYVLQLPAQLNLLLTFYGSGRG